MGVRKQLFRFLCAWIKHALDRIMHSGPIACNVLPSFRGDPGTAHVRWCAVLLYLFE